MNGRILPWLLLLGLNAAAWLFFAREKAGAAKTDRVAFARETAEHPGAVAITNVIVQTNEFEWRQLESEDYREYIQRLRAIGCPEETINDIIIADLEKLMASRVREVEGPVEPPQYWKPSRKNFTSTLAALEKLGQKQEVDFEKREIVRELLGIDLSVEKARARGEQDFYEERLAFLPPEKLAKVRMIMERANQEEMVLREKSWLESDQLTARDRAGLREIQQRKEQQIAALLDPNELEQFNLWFSPSAYKVREAFLALEPNEDDFLALYRMQSAFDAVWGGVEPADLDAGQRQEYTEAKHLLEASMREYLGEEKYQRLQHARDPDFRQLQNTVVQFGLSPEVTSAIYDYRAALQEERARVRENKALTEDRRRAVVRALNEETEQAVVEAMGPKAYSYYVRNGAGKWIWETDSH